MSLVQLKPGWTFESKFGMNMDAKPSATISSSRGPIKADKVLLQRTILDWRLNRLKGSVGAAEAMVDGPLKAASSKNVLSVKREKKEVSWDEIIVGCRIFTASESGIVVRKATYHFVENIVDEVGDLPADFEQITEQYRFAWLLLEGRYENWKLVELSEVWDVEAMSHEMLLTHDSINVRAFGRALLNKSGEEIMQQWIDSGRYNNQDSETLFDKDLAMTFPSETTQHNLDLAKSIGRTPDKKRLLEIFIKLQNAYAYYTK
jgi:hypothetical protein